MFNELRKYNKLWLQFACWMFAAILASVLLLLILAFVLYKVGIVETNPFDYRISLLSMLAGSIFIGCIVATIVSRLFLKPIRKIGDGFEELSRGNFDIRVPTDEWNSDMREISEHFNRLASELGRVETLRSDFVANISHEFKTPISAIEGYTVLLQNPKLSREKHDKYVEKILINTERLSAMTTNILMLSKLENQETVLRKTEYSLDEQLRRAVLLLEEKWTARDIAFDIDLPRVLYAGDEKLLDTVWFNLLDNAIKYSPPGGTVTVRIRQEPQTVTVTVGDTGCGMSEETMKHLFEKFYQGDSSHKSEGNGLGLALVKRIVELCRGTVAVDSRVGEGTVFTVTLRNTV